MDVSTVMVSFMGNSALSFVKAAFWMLALSLFFSSPSKALTGGHADKTLAKSSIMVLKSNGGVCSGVIIAQNVILTAAHCATGAEQYRIHYRSDDGSPVMLEPERVTIHPHYVAGAVKSRKPSIDLALIKLRANLPNRFTPASLSSVHPVTDQSVLTGGFGLSEAKNPRSMGQFLAAQFKIREPYGPGKFLIWLQGGQESAICTGDSGGPIEHEGAVFAITAWAEINKNTLCGPQSQGVLLGPQRIWIDKTLQEWGQQAQWVD
jgi:hypothetical protein